MRVFWNGLIVFLVFFAYQANGQNIKLIDSLKRSLSDADVSTKFRLLNSIGFEFRYSHPDSTIYYCKEAYQIGLSLDLKTDLAQPLSFIGLASAYKGDYSNSLSYYEEAIKTATSQNDSVQIAYGYNNLGRMFLDQGDYVRAYNYIIRSRDIFEIIDNKVGLAYVFRSLSGVYKSQNDFSQAIIASGKALEFRQQIGDQRAIISSWMELGLVQQAMGDQKAAFQSFKKADSIATLIRDNVTQLEVKAGMAEILYEDKKVDAAFQTANEVLKVVTSNTNQKLYLRAALIKARYYFDNKQTVPAVQLFKEILSEAEESGNVEFQKEASFFLNKLYEKGGNTVLAKAFNDKYTILKEIMQNTDLTRQIERLQFQLEIEKKERENELLKANKAKNEALISQQRFNNVLLVIIVASISIVTVITIRANRKRRIINRKLEVKNRHILNQQEIIARRNSELFKRNEELRQLNHEKDTLMNIVAHDLKSPLNRIQGLTTLLELEKSANAEYLQHINSATRGGLDMITDLLDVNTLEESRNKPQYSSFAIDKMLNETISQFESMAKAKSIKLTSSLKYEGEIISNESYINRVVDNLLSNAIKFSLHHTHVNVECDLTGEKLSLTIKDEGPGFTQEDLKFLFHKFKKLSARPTGGETSNGLGLAIVKILVDRLGGEIRLETVFNKGSKFIVEIPVGKETHRERERIKISKQ